MYKFHKEPQSFKDAVETCAVEGAHLADVKTEETYAYLMKVYEKGGELPFWNQMIISKTLFTRLNLFF